MEQTVAIRGMGWVFPESMGHPGQITPLANALPELKGKNLPAGPHKPFGRMDGFSKLGFTAIAFAMAHAGIAPHGPQRPVGMVAATATGCLSIDARYQEKMNRNGGKQPNPALFAYTLPSCFLGEAAIYFQLTGEGLVLEESCPTGLSALNLALDIMEETPDHPMLCGICDTENHPGALFLLLDPIVRPGDGKLIQRRNSEGVYLNGSPLNKIVDLLDIP